MVAVHAQLLKAAQHPLGEAARAADEDLPFADVGDKLAQALGPQRVAAGPGAALPAPAEQVAHLQPPAGGQLVELGAEDDVALPPAAVEEPDIQPSEQEEFLFGIDLILDGVQALIDRANRGGRTE